MFYSQSLGLLLQKPRGVKPFSSEAIMGKDKQNKKALEEKKKQKQPNLLCSQKNKSKNRKKIQRKKIFTRKDLNVRACIEQCE